MSHGTTSNALSFLKEDSMTAGDPGCVGSGGIRNTLFFFSERDSRKEALLGTGASPQQEEKIHFEMHGDPFVIPSSPDDQIAGGN